MPGEAAEDKGLCSPQSWKASMEPEKDSTKTACLGFHVGWGEPRSHLYSCPLWICLDVPKPPLNLQSTAAC